MVVEGEASNIFAASWVVDQREDEAVDTPGERSACLSAVGCMFPIERLTSS